MHERREPGLRHGPIAARRATRRDRRPLTGLTRTVALALVPALLMALALASVGCGGPLGPFAGGRLRGELGPPLVADWSFASAERTLALEACPADPHSVQVWFAAIGSRLYVPSSMIAGAKDPSERRWVRCLEEDPRVRIRVGGLIFERRAVRIEDPAEYEAARDALEARHGLDPLGRDADRAIWIYRLSSRS